MNANIKRAEGIADTIIRSNKVNALASHIEIAREQAIVYRHYDIVAIYSHAIKEFERVDWDYTRVLNLIDYNINCNYVVPTEWLTELHEMRNKLV